MLTVIQNMAVNTALLGEQDELGKAGQWFYPVLISLDFSLIQTVHVQIIFCLFLMLWFQISLNLF